jgi:nucleoside-diphosphate-sugar epimerase
VPVLVTGGSGVVGLHLLRALADAGEAVVSVSRRGRSAAAGFVLGPRDGDVVFAEGDVCDFERLAAIAREHEIEGIIHTAALTGERRARARPDEVVRANLMGTANVLEVARRMEVRRVVYTGSSSEYGPRPDLRAIHEDEVNPEGLYAETKRLSAMLGRRYADTFGLSFVTCRINSAFGPGSRFSPERGLVGHTLISHLTRAAALGEPVRLESGADSPRGWTYARDTAVGLVSAYRHPSPAHDTYNIASGRSYVVGEVVEILKSIEPGADIEVGPGRWEDDPRQQGAMRGPLDITRARTDLGFDPPDGLEDGLRACIEWWRSPASAAEGPAARAPGASA